VLFKAVEEYQGHAYSLMLLGTWLRDATEDHHIRRRQEIPLLDEDRQHGSHADQLFGAYVLHLGADSPEVALLRLLGLFDRAARRDLIDVLCESRADPLDGLTAPLRGLSQADWNRLFSRLQKLRLIVVADAHQQVDAHPLLREYFGARLRNDYEDAFRAAHSRLFEHLCETTRHRPDTLDGLQPLYQAVVHGCLAGRQQEAREKVYRHRVRRGAATYSIKKLGAMGADLAAVAAFFDEPWRRVSPNLGEADQAWLLAPAERTAWQRGTGFRPVANERRTPRGTSPADATSLDAALDACAEVERRAESALGRAEQFGHLLDIALDHLMLARVGLVRAILTQPQPTLDLPHIADAVNGLRSAERSDYLPRALLTAAWYHFVRVDPDQAKHCLDEAQQIADRGPMPLYLADILLHRARLWGSWKSAQSSEEVREYPWPDASPQADLAQARRLIEQHGYGRRQEELEDVEAVVRDRRPT